MPEAILGEVADATGFHQRDRKRDAVKFLRTMLVAASSPSGGRQADIMRQYFETGGERVVRGSFHDWFGGPLEAAMAKLSQIALAHARAPGRAYVFLGGAALLFDSTADATITGSAVIFFGSAVGIVGDVNGDNVADFAIGATGSASSSGAVYIYHGGSSGVIDTVADGALAGEAANDVFGEWLASHRAPFFHITVVHCGVDASPEAMPATLGQEGRPVCHTVGLRLTDG